MLFYQPAFLFIVFPIFYLVYLSLNKYNFQKKILLAIFSGIFYLWIEAKIVPIVVLSILIDYVTSKKISSTNEKSRSIYLFLGIAQNLAILFYFKYTVFALNNVNALGSWLNLGPISVPAIALPVGISFIIFEKISYLVDVFRRTSQPATSLTNYSLYVLLFPKLLAGPIIKYHEIEDQLNIDHRTTLKDAVLGFERFMLGVIKKLLIADTVGIAADAIFKLPNSEQNFSSAWAGCVLFTLQIYFDFSSYSDMAIGLARMLGFRLNENFAIPYISRTMTEFWRRWHISLSTYIRDYVYIPLGGNQLGKRRTYINLWIAFILSGIWHGANWTFIIWGAYNGLFLTLDRLFLARWMSILGDKTANILTLFVIMIGWVIFRAADVHQASIMLYSMLRPEFSPMPLTLGKEVFPIMIIAAILSISPRFFNYQNLKDNINSSLVLMTTSRIALALLFIVAVARAVATPFHPFLYFRF